MLHLLHLLQIPHTTLNCQSTTLPIYQYPDYRSDDNKESMMKAYKALNKLTQTYTMNDQMRGPMIMHPTACCVSSRQP